GIATQTSIGKLLIAGVVPGIVAGILLAVMVYLWVVISPKHAPSTYRVSAQERWASLVRIWPSLLLILLVLVLLYTGIATPTEVGALGALLAGVIGAVFGRLTFAAAIDACETHHPPSGDVFSHPPRPHLFRLLHGVEPLPPGGGPRRHRHEPQSLGGHHRHRGGLFRDQHVHGRNPSAPAHAAAHLS